jgi:type II secretion system protein H
MGRERKMRGRAFPTGECGFSLIELMVIIVIVGILAAVAWLRLSQLEPRYRLDGAARSLAMDLQKTRGRAIAENKCFMVVINSSAKTYQLQSKSGTGACGSSGYAVDSQDPAARKIDDVLTVDNGSGGAPVSPIFTPRGASEATNSVFPTIRLSNSLGDARLVLVNQVGRVVVQ